ncbi:MAG: DUF488 domain-containing protein [Nitrospirota bacterium]
MINVKRVYDTPEPNDGARFLVDRLWPRGVGKADLKFDGWLKDVAPSDNLRRWFGHEETKWGEFQNRYVKELKANPMAWQPILKAARRGNVTLLYSARDKERNNAVVLRAYLKTKRASGRKKP